MSQQIVIYAAANLPQAHLLKNELQRYGIRAWVTNEVLSRGFSVECPGWATLPRVTVEEKDAIAARQIALSHDKNGAQKVECQLPDPSHFEHNPQEWPRCPECGAPRPTHCPVCKTSGTDFPETDPDFAWGFGLEEVHDEQENDDAPKEAGSSCSCSKHGGCSGAATGGAPLSEEPESTQDEGDEEDQPRPFILRCTMCDEPFSPEFTKHCVWCEHEFEDGYEVEPAQRLPIRNSSDRILLTVVVLLMIGGLVFWVLTQ